MIGNFIADRVRKTELDNFPGEIIHGIRLHHFIDAFTDAHPVVEQSKARLRSQFRKYAPVIVDIFYDHFLAKNWNQYHSKPLEVYSQEKYAQLSANEMFFPERIRKLFFYMKNQDWLFHYRSLEGIHQALSGMAQRTRFESGLEYAINPLQQYYGQFENEFYLFFPLLVKACREMLADTGQDRELKFE